jgi:hypothetical protein
VCLSFFDEFLFQIFGRETEGYIHEGTAVFVSVALVETVGVIKDVINELCFALRCVPP